GGRLARLNFFACIHFPDLNRPVATRCGSKFAVGTNDHGKDPILVAFKLLQGRVENKRLFLRLFLGFVLLVLGRVLVLLPYIIFLGLLLGFILLGFLLLLLLLAVLRTDLERTSE